MKKFLLLIMLCCFGCQSTSKHSYMNAMKEHRDDITSVNNSLILAFQAEMESEPRPEAKAAYQEIITNLQILKYQADILYQYNWNQLSEKELIEIFRSKWRTK